MSKRLVMLILRRIKPISFILLQYLELAVFVAFALKGVGKRVRRYKYMIEKVDK